MGDMTDALRKMLSEVLVPLVEEDGGELYLVSISKKELSLHLAGSLGGSPATPTVKARILEPAVRAVSPNVKLTVASGWTIPEGATRLSS